MVYFPSPITVYAIAISIYISSLSLYFSSGFAAGGQLYRQQCRLHTAGGGWLAGAGYD